jgi:uncharacterized lipoprotein YbaY
MVCVRILLMAWLAALATGACCATRHAPPAALVVRGQLALPGAGERPGRGSLAIVELHDTEADRVLVEQRLSMDGASAALPFELRLPPDRRPPGRSLSVRGALLDGGRAAWLSEPVVIAATVAAADVGTLQMARAPRQLAFQTRINCGMRQFVVGMAGDTLTLSDGERFFALQPAAADLDQRFEAVDDSTTFVLTHGTTATVAVHGVSYVGCSLLR